jgi:hypothetical protein
MKLSLAKHQHCLHPGQHTLTIYTLLYNFFFFFFFFEHIKTVILKALATIQTVFPFLAHSHKNSTSPWFSVHDAFNPVLVRRHPCVDARRHTIAAFALWAKWNNPNQIVGGILHWPLVDKWATRVTLTVQAKESHPLRNKRLLYRFSKHFQLTWNNFSSRVTSDSSSLQLSYRSMFTDEVLLYIYIYIYIANKLSHVS